MMTPKRPDYNARYKTVLVYIGKDADRLARWQAAADAAGMSLGAWLASLADRAATAASPKETSP